MNSRVSWSVDGIDPSVRDRAEAAARRAGMTLNDWLNSTIGSPGAETSPPNLRNIASQPAPVGRDVGDIHQRLDSITRQIEQISQAPRRNEATREHGVAFQLNEAISRLDARLAQIKSPQQSRQARELRDGPAEALERAAAQDGPDSGRRNAAHGISPSHSPASLHSAMADIAARQSDLEPRAPRPTPSAAPPMAPPAPAPQGPDFSSLERHLVKITSQIEAMQRPSGIEQSIAAFRSELTEIRNTILDAMPRGAIESLEGEIRSLSRRIDDSRQGAVDGEGLASIERTLFDIREVLRSLAPAEQLTGYDEAIRSLSAKLDAILRAKDDPGTVQPLENAILALRAIVSNVASNEALARLSEDVHELSSKVDQLTRRGDAGDSFAAIEQRIAALTSALESRERPAFEDGSAQLEDTLRTLSERIDRLKVDKDSAATFAHLEQRVSYLLERVEASGENRGGKLSRLEDALQDILGHLERQHAAFVRLADSPDRGAEPQDSAAVDLVKRELSAIRSSHSETSRQTQDSLKTVNTTLGHVVDRLTLIEGDLRTVHAAPAPAVTPPAATTAVEVEVAPPRAAAAPRANPELPNSTAARAAFGAAPRNSLAPTPAAAALARPSASIGEILAPRAAIAPDLPPDHPLEPGTRPRGRSASPSERIALSENAIGEVAAPAKPPFSSSSFIAAARRAAQAAAAAQTAPEKGRATIRSPGGDGAKERSSIASKLRALLVAASAVVIVLGTFKTAMLLLESRSAPQGAPVGKRSGDPPARPRLPADISAAPATPEEVMPRMTSPDPIGRQSFNNAIESTTEPPPPIGIPQTTGTDITGTIATAQPPPRQRTLSSIQVPPGEDLPVGIGGPMLRAAALKGDPTAAYEVAVRFAEGRGAAANFEEAAKWYDRAAQAGVIPATFQLGTLYEKGLWVKKDVDIARHYYVQAAERGNAKAMHNLAVLDADGSGEGADYSSAAQWFRKAAEHGLADSQFNLGILYARGIGVEQNLAESFKWFSLAAAQGDADAGRKRDDVIKRMDAQSLAAGKLALQSFVAEPQPDDAINVPTPPGGWDAAPVVKPAAAQPAATVRASR